MRSGKLTISGRDPKMVLRQNITKILTSLRTILEKPAVALLLKNSPAVHGMRLWRWRW